MPFPGYRPWNSDTRHCTVDGTQSIQTYERSTCTGREKTGTLGFASRNSMQSLYVSGVMRIQI